MKIEQLYTLFKQSSGVSIDTRNIPDNALFFALKGERFNANKFAKQAIDNGAKLAVVDEVPENLPPDKYILVDNTLKTLQELATYHRSLMTFPFIGITGSNGKTTTKEIIFHLLNTSYTAFATKGNFNNHIGVPLTLLSIPPDTEIAIIEMGANHIGEIAQLCQIAQPDYGIITNIGNAHLEGFGSFKGVIKAKTELYEYIKHKNGKIFVNTDDALLVELSKHLPQFTYGTSKKADIQGTLLQDIPFIEMEWNAKQGKKHQVVSSLFGKYNFYNLLAGIAIAKYFNVPDIEINNAIATFKSTNNRSEIVKTEHNTLILDAYNANPSSMQQAITAFARFQADNKILILGDMFELGTHASQHHQEIIDLATKNNFRHIYFVGNEFYQLKTDLPHAHFLPTTEELIKLIKEQTIKNATLLIKGSRSMKLEQMVRFL